MDFFIKLHQSHELSVKQEYTTDLRGICCEPNVLYIEKLIHLDYLSVCNRNQVWCFGDVINFDQENSLANKGLFYAIEHKPDQRVIDIRNDYNSLLPVYYCEENGAIMVSSSFDLIAANIKDRVLNPQFITDLALFNIPLQHECFYKEIFRVPYGKQIRIGSGGIELIHLRRVWDDFCPTPVPYKKAVGDIAECFIENCRSYFTSPSYVALTGGFDGRTNAAVAHFYKNDFECFTHGILSSSDVQVPISITAKLGIPHHFIELSEEYLSRYHLRFVNEYLRYSGGMNGFLYPHLIYDAYVLSQDNKPVITGFCGSELMRNAHFGGAVTSQVVIDILNKGNEFAIERIMGNPNYLILGEGYFNRNLCEYGVYNVAKYFQQLPHGISKNQKLAIFEFEEVLPKLFGSSIYAAMHYNRTRVPFMDIEFYRAILKTEVSQVYRNFMEQNPLKRFWGQYLYAKVISTTWPELGFLNSSKGYAPADLLTIKGKINIIKGFSGKKKRLSAADYDGLSIVSGLSQYLRNKFDIMNLSDIFNDLERLKIDQHRRDIACVFASATEYKNSIVS